MLGVLGFAIFLSALLVHGCEAFPGYTQQNGRTRLLGSSFGVLGVNATFDYVIVGGGTSGLVVAKRLSEDPSVSVAVIEAGSFYEFSNGNHSQVPAYDFYASSGSPTDLQPLVDWGLITVPQEQLGGRRIHFAQGKCFGGGSARNYLAFQRGTKGSYQAWANIVGDRSYEYDQFQSYFKRSPQFTPPDYSKRGGPQVPFDTSAFDAQGGPLQVAYPNYYAPISDGAAKGFREVGIKEIPGLNSGNLIGYAEFTLSVDNIAAARSSSETSFLQDSLASGNLLYYQQTLAKQITFDSNKHATGVMVNTAGVQYLLSARKEVIVAAGAFRSPQLLMVSGVGPKQQLGSIGVPVIADLRGVGQNLQDQPLYGVSYRVNVPTNSRLTNNASFAFQATQDYLNHQKGPLSSSGGNYVGWEKLPEPYRSHLTADALKDLARFPRDWPELELLPSASTQAPTNDTADYASMTVALVASTSRGNVTLSSKDTSVNPLINPNWLGTSTDQQVAIGGFRRARQIFNATGLVVGPEFSPGAQVQTDEQILAYIRKTMTTIHHAVGTCPMGKKGDNQAVVDSNGKVFGVTGLRIVDSSVFPILPPGHPQATVFLSYFIAFVQALHSPTSHETFHQRNYFYVGGHYINITEGAYTSGRILIDQLYVEELLPPHPTHPYPIVLWSGDYQTGTNWLNTPDGRRGWASHFLSAGYKVYIVDQPSRGRSLWHLSTSVSAPEPTRQLNYSTVEYAERYFTASERFGLWPQAELHTQWPGLGVHGDEVFDRFFASQVQALANGTETERVNRDGGRQLMARIGESVLVVHSQAGAFGWGLADEIPGLVRGVVAVEPSGPPFHEEILATVADRPYGLTSLPLTYSPPFPHPTNLRTKVVPPPDPEGGGKNLTFCALQAEPSRQLVNIAKVPVQVITSEASFHAPYDWCTVAFLEQAGVTVDWVNLPNLGIYGNGHFVFLEKNSREIWNLVENWMQKLEKIY
ncbi:MAG: hypothetical protein MMC23_009818 [Stictis urceolatum]|nr:hypothetical protein [Stictis urceolata]